MQPETLGLLTDLQEAARYFEGETTRITHDELVNVQRTREAVLYSQLAIGEAVNRLRRGDPGTADRFSGVPHIVGLRSALIHGYGSINDRTVWHTFTFRCLFFAQRSSS